MGRTTPREGKLTSGSHYTYLSIDSGSQRQRKKSDRHLSAETTVGKLVARCT